jgi:hypothetical protein
MPRLGNEREEDLSIRIQNQGKEKSQRENQREKQRVMCNLRKQAKETPGLGNGNGASG